MSRSARRRMEKLRAQRKAAAIRTKYGPRRKPSPVVVRRIDTGEVIKVVDQSSLIRQLEGPRSREAGVA